MISGNGNRSLNDAFTYQYLFHMLAAVWMQLLYRQQEPI
jgi:hypothetical protein